MKIKLVTFAPHPNFGTCLQSYALNKVLRDMGHNVEFIYNGRETKPITILGYAKRGIRKIVRLLLPLTFVESIKKHKEHKGNANADPVILSLPNHTFLNLLSKFPFYSSLYKCYKCKNLQWKKVYKFTYEDGNFKMRRIYTHKQYEEVTSDADLFITGSDQIWNPFCGGYNPMMLLEFVNDGTKCVSYSSSISQPEIHPSIKSRMKTALQKFSHIAVREQRSVDLLNQLLGRNDVKLVVDPTYLLPANEWEEFGNKSVLEFELPEKYIFCYFVGCKRADVYEQMVQDVKAFTGIENVITLDCYNRDLNYGGGRLYKDAGPYEWVYLLRHASYVCMDSFHATVFALKFQKEFVQAMKNEENEVGSQNTRMHDIFNRYGIMYKNYTGHDDKSWQKKIDYNVVTPIIDAEIKDSMEYLKYEINN